MRDSELQGNDTLTALAARTTRQLIELCSAQGTVPDSAQIERFTRAFAAQLGEIPPEVWSRTTRFALPDEMRASMPEPALDAFLGELHRGIREHLLTLGEPLLALLAAQTWQLESERAARVVAEAALPVH